MLLAIICSITIAIIVLSVGRSYLSLKKTPKPVLNEFEDLSRAAAESSTLIELSSVKNRLETAVIDSKLQLWPDNSADQVGPILNFAGAVERAWQVETMEQMASFRWPNLSGYPKGLFPDALISAVDALKQLGDTADRVLEITAPLQMANTLLEVNEQLVLLTRAQYELKDLREGFGPLLSRVVSHWAEVIKREGERLRQARAIEPIPNPYVIGNPVRGALFVGREDVMRRLEELWSSPGPDGQYPSVVIYGHRRMGKSSVLQNLSSLRMPQRSIFVDFNLQRIGRVGSTGELLFSLALKLYDAAQSAGLNLREGGLYEPAEEDYTPAGKNPYLAFDRFIEKLGRLRDGHRFLITVDEFELFEEQIAEGRLEPHLLAAFRATFQTYPWFIMAFAGLHRLEELRHDYWHPLFGSVSAVEVGFLSESAARNLITAPSLDFAIDYEKDAIARIYELTHGQPYLVQLICHSLVSRYNRQVVELALAPPRRFALDSVEAVVDQPELFLDGTLYFQGVWERAARSLPQKQTVVLQALAEHVDGQTLDELGQKPELGEGDAAAALRTLLRHAVIEKHGERHRFTVELMRRWVRDRRQLA